MERISSIVANAKTAAVIAEGRLKAGITEVSYLQGKVAECNQYLAETEEKLVTTREELRETSQKLKKTEFELRQTHEDIYSLGEKNRLMSIKNTELNKELEALKNKQEALLANINCAKAAIQKRIAEDKFLAKEQARDFFGQIIRILEKDFKKNNNEDYVPGSA